MQQASFNTHLVKYADDFLEFFLESRVTDLSLEDFKQSVFLHKILNKRLKQKRWHKVHRERAHWGFKWFTKPFFADNFFIKRGAVATKVWRRWFKRIPRRKFRFVKKYWSLFGLFRRWKRTHIKRVTNSLKLYSLKHSHQIERPKNVFSLPRRVFLTQKRIKMVLWRSLYRSTKYKLLPRQLKYKKKSHIDKLFFKKRVRRKTIFLNVYRPLLSKLRRARFAHWGIRTFGKLNEYRYNKLLAFELKLAPKLHYMQFLFLFLLHTYTANLSWKQLKRLCTYNLVFLNGQPAPQTSILKVGDIVELPFSISLVKRRLKLKKLFFKIVKRVRKLSYKSFLAGARRNKHIKKYKVVPKIFKRLPVGLKMIGNCVALDPTLNVFAVIKKLPLYTLNIEKKLFVTSVLTLQNWRYRFD